VILYADSLADLAATLLSGLFSLLPVLDVTVSATIVTALAWVVLVLGVAGPIVSLRYAVRRFDTYRPY
jgi:ABC-2 type transport system permease protein